VDLSGEVQVQLDKLSQVMTTGLDKFNIMLKSKNLEPVKIEQK